MGQTWKDPKKGEKKINANGDHREVSHHVVYVSPLYIYVQAFSKRLMKPKYGSLRKKLNHLYTMGSHG